MNILHVNNKFHFQGGTEQYLHAVCSDLKEQGHRNSVLFGGRQVFADLDRIVDRSLNVPDLDLFGVHGKKSLEDLISPLLDQAFPEVIFLHNIHNPDLLEILTRTAPVVKFVHDHEFYCPKGVRMLDGAICRNFSFRICLANALRGGERRCMGSRRPARILRKAQEAFLNRHIHRKVSRFVVASRHMRDNLESLGFHRSRIAVIPYFTEVPVAPPGKEESKTILYVGRISPEKGLDAFLTVLSLLREDYSFLLVGEGEPGYMDHLRRAAAEAGLGPRVHFAGWVDNPDLSPFFQKAALTVIPSVWPEPFCIAGIESMAHGRPVVAYDVGGISDWLVDGEAGFLVARGEKEEFARKIDLLLDDVELRSRMGDRGRKRAAELYRKTSHTGRLLALFADVISKDS